MCKIAVGVITYNHPEIVLEVLQNCIQDYFECGIDIYYFDSSDNDETKKIVDAFVQKGYENLYYLHYPSTTRSNIKLQDILSGRHFEKQYDYIWPIKDRSYCMKETLEEILRAAEEKPDILFLGVFSLGEQGALTSGTYHCGAEFYRDWAWLATSLDVAIYRCDTILEDFQERIREEKYKMEYTLPFMVYTYLFCKIAVMQDVNIRLLRGKKIKIINSPLGQSGWQKHTFQLWKDFWIKVNDELPDCYNEYKADTIKKTVSLPWILGSTNRLMELNKAGLLTVENVEMVLQDWNRISDIPADTVRAIALGSYDCFHDLQSLRNIKSDIMEILIELAQIVEKNDVCREQIPLEDISNCIFKELVEKRVYSQEQLNIIMGSVLDIGSIIINEKAEKKDVRNGVQMLISILLAMN